MNAIVESKQFSLAPQNLEEAFRFADMMSKSNLVPKEFAGNPGNILVAIQWGAELGLQPMQAMQNIAVINGRPSLWGDSVIGIVKASPLCEYVTEETTDDQAVCKVKRRGEPEQVRVFSTSDAKKAGLLNKPGPWTQYPKRMMQMRARSWALRDVFPDVLRGMPIAEEVMDIPTEKNVTPRQSGVQIAEAARQAPIVESPDRQNLIFDLEALASDQGIDAYEAAFKALTPMQRKLLGADEHNRLKAIAQNYNVIDITDAEVING